MTAAASRPWFWGAFAAGIVVLALVAGYAALRESRQLAQLRLEESAPAETAQPQAQPARGLIELVLHGESRRLSPDAVRAMAPHLARRAAARQASLRARLERLAREGAARAFAPAAAKVPRFADWYYSLQGEYTRYAKAIGGDLGGYLAGRFEAMVMGPADLEGRLNRLNAELNAELAQGLAAGFADLSAELDRLSGIHAQSAPVAAERTEVRGRLDLDDWLAERMAVDADELGREAAAALAAVGVGTVVAKGLGAVVAKKVVAQVAGGKGFQVAVALLAQAGAKGAVKGGGVLAAGAGGAAVCSPSGPVAVVCGAVAAAVTWLAVDKAFIEVDEALHREQFEAELRAALAAEERRLIEHLVQAYDRLVTDRYAALANDFLRLRPAPGVGRETFVPAEAGRPGGASQFSSDFEKDMP